LEKKKPQFTNSNRKDAKRKRNERKENLGVEILTATGARRKRNERKEIQLKTE
jgi:hypothetical protein